MPSGEPCLTDDYEMAKKEETVRVLLPQTKEAAATHEAGHAVMRWRWSASRKRDVVLRLLRGASLEALSREAGVEIYRLEAWRARAMAGLELG